MGSWKSELILSTVDKIDSLLKCVLSTRKIEGTRKITKTCLEKSTENIMKDLLVVLRWRIFRLFVFN